MSQLASDAAEIDRASADASAAVRAAQEREARLDVTRDELAAQVSTERDRALQSDAAGSESSWTVSMRSSRRPVSTR